MGRWYQLAALAIALGLPGCAATPAPARDPQPPIAGRVASLAVTFPEPGASARDRERGQRAAAAVRQSALDWLEDAGRLATGGDLAVEVALEDLRLRGALATWLFAWAAPPDHLSARVAVRRRGLPEAAFELRVESALAGYAWRDPEERLARLARRLGRRLSGRLESGL